MYIARFAFQVIYKASLLHLQPRQMRLEMTDMQEDIRSDPFEDEDEEANEYSDEDDDRFVQEEPPVSMRADVLRASVGNAEAAAVPGDTTEAAGKEPAVAIAPLPTRLSFCVLSPPATGTAQQPPARLASNEASICEAAAEAAAAIPRPAKKSPVKTVVGQVLARSGEIEMEAPQPSTSESATTPIPPTMRPTLDRANMTRKNIPVV